MTFIYTESPLAFRCPNRSCAADVDVACRTVGGHVSATPHTPRLRLAVEGRQRGEHKPQEYWKHASDRYTRAILEELIGRAPEPELVARAIKDGSLHVDRGWLKAAIGAGPAIRTHAQPLRRVSGRETTLWGRVIRTEQLPSGSFLLALHTGEIVRLPGSFWATVWPERLAVRAELELEHPELRGGWWRFMIVDGECSAADEEPDRPIVEAKAPAAELPGQMALF